MRLAFGRRFGIEIRGDVGRDLDGPRGGELQLAAIDSQFSVVHPEVDQMAPAVADIRPAFLDPLRPAVEIELPSGSFT